MRDQDDLPDLAWDAMVRRVQSALEKHFPIKRQLDSKHEAMVKEREELLRQRVRIRDENAELSQAIGQAEQRVLELGKQQQTLAAHPFLEPS